MGHPELTGKINEEIKINVLTVGTRTTLNISAGEDIEERNIHGMNCGEKHPEMCYKYKQEILNIYEYGKCVHVTGR